MDKLSDKHRGALEKIEQLENKIRKTSEDETQQASAAELSSQLTVAFKEEAQVWLTSC